MQTDAHARCVGWVVGVAVAAVVLAGCGSQPGDSAAERTQTTPLSVAGHIAGAQAAALTGDQRAMQDHVNGLAKGVLRDARIPDPSRPIPREAARSHIMRLSGVRSVAWVDHDNLLVLVGGAQFRDMAMVDQVCDALAPLGDTMGVVVNVQDVTATTSAGADAVSRDCQLPEGQRAFLQHKRQIEALDPATRRVFEAQQAGGRH